MKDPLDTAIEYLNRIPPGPSVTVKAARAKQRFRGQGTIDKSQATLLKDWLAGQGIAMTAAGGGEGVEELNQADSFKLWKTK